MKFWIKQTHFINEFFHNHASKNMKYDSQVNDGVYFSNIYIQKSFTTHSRNDFDFWSESGEILLKIKEKTRILWILTRIWCNFKSHKLTSTMSFFITTHPKNMKYFFSTTLWRILLKYIFKKNLRHIVAMISIFEMKVVKFCAKSMKIQEI